MKKVFLLIFVSILLLVAFTSCDRLKGPKLGSIGKKECTHSWTEATCQAPKTCTLCGVTEGAAAKHKTVAPTCTTPEMCEVCGFTTEFWSPATGHDWLDASCLKGTAKTCRLCGLVEGEVPEHQWSTPTCLTDAKCEVCNMPGTGTALGHDYVYVAEVSPTCTETGTTEGHQCSRCGDVRDGIESIPALEHKGFEVVVEGTAATCTESGLTPGKKCDKCGAITEPQLVISPKGHQRYTYDDLGNVTADGYLRTEYPVNPDTGLPYAECEFDGAGIYKCQVCEEDVTFTVSKIDHEYPLGSTCKDEDAKCEYCNKSIEHEFLDPTCTEAATCRICSETDDTRPALNHTHVETGESAFAPATCLAPSTCALCGATEGEKLVHTLQFESKPGKLSYTCTRCDTTFTLQDETYYLDGTDHTNIVPVNNKFGGYDTHVDTDGNATQYPKIETDASGNRYYSLIKVKDPEKDKDGKDYPPQTQLWIPMQRSGFEGFNSFNAAVGFLSFKINAYMDKNFHVSLLEASSGWTEADAIQNIFNLVSPTEGDSKLRITGIDDKNADTPELVLFEKELAGVSSVADKFTGWLDVYIGIVLDDATDTVTFHYYINGNYKGSVTMPLLTSGNGIKCVYFSGNTNENGSGLMLDEIAFGYTAVGSWPFDVNHEHSYNIKGEELEPTCTTDGYVIYSCSCGETGMRVTYPALGHQAYTAEAKAPTCTESGNNAYSYCTREDCGAELVAKEIYPANGHDYEIISYREPTCTSGGLINEKCTVCEYSHRESLSKLDHTYDLSGDCTQVGVCLRCNTTSTRPIGHEFAPATCTAPKTCMRDGCTATEGDPLGHDFADPTCAKAPTCKVCDYAEGDMLLHTISSKYVKSKLTYYCTGCSASFHFETGYTLNGTTHDNMVGHTNNGTNYSVATGTQLPQLVDGYYQLINTSGKEGQVQLWVPVNENSNNFGFSSENNAVGMLAFKINANMTKNLDIKLVDAISNQGSYRWKAGGIAGHISISTVTDGKVTFKLGTVDTDGNQVNVHEIANVDVDSKNFTGWVDIMIGIVLDPVTDQITYHCYTNGEYVLSFSAELTTRTNSINAIYLSGNTATKGTGIMLDDIAFGYTANGTWVFNECKHEGAPVVTPPTCTVDGYTTTVCTKCNHIEIADIVPAFGHTEKEAPTCTLGYLCETCGEYYGDPLGHKGGEATCTEKAVCEVCEQPYGETAHTVVEATCAKASYCSACGEVFGNAVSHKPVAVLADEKLSYECEYCKQSFKLSKFYYHNVEESIGAIAPTDENSKYNGGSTEKGYYEFIHDDTNASGKAVIWVPNGNGGITNFEGFTTASNAVGVVSFSVNAYTSGGLNMQLVDTDLRGGGDQKHLLEQNGVDFWKGGALPAFFTISAPEDNVVTISGWNGTLKTIKVSDADKYTGWVDITVGIKLSSSGSVTLYYYVDGEYVGEATKTMNILTNKIDGLYINAVSNVPGSGYKVDNIVLGYATPTDQNPAPLKP